MERKSSKRKFLRRKFKRYAAAVAGAAAGAAILTGTALPGMPAAKALASEDPSIAQVRTEQVVKLDENNFRDHRDNRRNNGWHEHRHSWPSPDENQVLYKDGRLYYRSDGSDRHYGYVHYLTSPVDFVKDYASKYGFDRYRDSFTILSQSSKYATVQVRKHDTGRFYRVDLERTYDRDWTIVGVHALYQ